MPKDEMVKGATFTHWLQIAKTLYWTLFYFHVFRKTEKSVKNPFYFHTKYQITYMLMFIFHLKFRSIRKGDTSLLIHTFILNIDYYYYALNKIFL